MAKLDQNRTPYLDALKTYIGRDTTQLDVPGHQQGNVSNLFKDFIGPNVFKCDVNAPIGLDNLANPHACLQEVHRYLCIRRRKSEKSYSCIHAWRNNDFITCP